MCPDPKRSTRMPSNTSVIVRVEIPQAQMYSAAR